MADLELKRVQMSSGFEIPAPDDLIAGFFVASPIMVKEPGEYSRGMLLMSSSDGYFEKATKAGVKTADEICILAGDIAIEEGEYTNAGAYFMGKFKGEKVILPYEEESDDHEQEISDIESTLRKAKIFLE